MGVAGDASLSLANWLDWHIQHHVYIKRYIHKVPWSRAPQISKNYELDLSWFQVHGDCHCWKPVLCFILSPSLLGSEHPTYSKHWTRWVVGKTGAAIETHAINVLGKSRNSTITLKTQISACIFNHLKAAHCFLSFFLGWLNLITGVRGWWAPD